VSLRKAVLIVTTMSLASVKLQMFSCICITSVCILLQLLYKPFVNELLNRAELTGLCSSWITFMCGYLVVETETKVTDFFLYSYYYYVIINSYY